MSTLTSPDGNRATIVTLTMNPALDITTSVDRVRPTDKLRCQGARHDPGGGGINVARIASVLGASVAAVFPAGGPTGDVIIHIDDQELSLREFGRLLRVHAGWGMRIAFVPEEFVTENPTVKVRKPHSRKGRVKRRQRP